MSEGMADFFLYREMNYKWKAQVRLKVRRRARLLQLSGLSRGLKCGSTV